jgi:predicted nuclease with TOPRIM domain
MRKLSQMEQLYNKMDQKLRESGSGSGLRSGNFAVTEIATAVSSEVKDDVKSLKEGMRDLADSVHAWQLEVDKLKESARSQRHVFDGLKSVQSQMQNMQDEMKQVRVEMEHGLARMQSQGMGKTNDQVELMKKRISDLEDNIQSLAELSKIQPVRSSVYEDEVNVLLEKIVFLESKISTLEQFLGNRNQRVVYQQGIERDRDLSPRPIIME